jgi:hypothetical protein
MLEIALAIHIVCLIWFIWMCHTAPLATEDDEFGFRIVKTKNVVEENKETETGMHTDQGWIISKEAHKPVA